MINQYHKSQANYDGMVKELGQKLVDLADGTFDEAEGHQNAVSLHQHLFNPKSAGAHRHREEGRRLLAAGDRRQRHHTQRQKKM